MIFPGAKFFAHVSRSSQSPNWLSYSIEPFLKTGPHSFAVCCKNPPSFRSSFHRQEMSASNRQQPAWEPPPQADPDAKLPPLQIWNSLTRSKTQFVPIDWKNWKVKWYACGPTVYDDAHLGHARNYITTDIIRRVMRDYFKFKLDFVMNITDVDDKVRFEDIDG